MTAVYPWNGLLDVLFIDLYTYRGNIFRRKFVCCVGYQKTGFAHSTVTNYDTFDCLHFEYSLLNPEFYVDVLKLI